MNLEGQKVFKEEQGKVVWGQVTTQLDNGTLCIVWENETAEQGRDPATVYIAPLYLPGDRAEQVA